mmetsp:Transcript_97792/g.224228  ORF Transcript_97792/g.224228 Transcript_97792/m.224228 type:complete len:501 (+) Transcript_97792:39-1541(+)
MSELGPGPGAQDIHRQHVSCLDRCLDAVSGSCHSRKKMPESCKVLDEGDAQIVQTSLHTLSIGASGKVKLLKYDLRNLVRLGGLLTFGSLGTVMNVSHDGWITILCNIVISAVVAAGVLLTMTNEEILDLKGADDLRELTKYMNGFCPFILGLYLSMTLTRWWDLRVKALGAHLDCICNLFMLACVHFEGQQHSQARARIKNLALASVVLVVRMARGHNEVNDLVGRGLLTQVEAETLQEAPLTERPMVIFPLLLQALWATSNAAELPAPNRNIFQVECIKARDAVQTIHTHLKTQLPFTYVHLIVMLVTFNNCLLSVKCGVWIALGVAESSSLKVGVQVIYVLVVPLLYNALLCVSYILEDPFGEDLLDFPMAAYTDGVKRFMSSVEVGTAQVRDEMMEMASQESLLRDPSPGSALRSSALHGTSKIDGASVLEREGPKTDAKFLELVQALTGSVGKLTGEIGALGARVVALEATVRTGADRVPARTTGRTVNPCSWAG